MNGDDKINKIIKKSAYFLIVILIIAVIMLLILKYHVEGEQNMPFELTDIIEISTAEGYQEKVDDENNWNVEIYQNNDIYLNIEKNKNYKEEESIKYVTIENINLINKPKVGEIYFYRPTSNDENLYIYKEEYEIKEKVVYEGDTKSDLKNLKISNQGNTIIFRVTNKTGKKYVSNDDILTHDGKLLNKVNINYEQIKTNISFDIIITLSSDVSYKANIVLDLPAGDVTKEGISNLNKKDMKDVIFKRE